MSKETEREPVPVEISTPGNDMDGIYRAKFDRGQAELDAEFKEKITEIITTVVSKDPPMCIFLEMPFPFDRNQDRHMRATVAQAFEGKGEPPPIFILQPGCRVTAVPLNDAGTIVINERWKE